MTNWSPQVNCNWYKAIADNKSRRIRLRPCRVSTPCLTNAKPQRHMLRATQILQLDLCLLIRNLIANCICELKKISIYLWIRSGVRKKKCVYRLTIMKDVTERKGLDGNKNLHLSDLQKRHYQRSCEATCRHMLEAKQLWFFIPH